MLHISANRDIKASLLSIYACLNMYNSKYWEKHVQDLKNLLPDSDAVTTREK